MVSGRKGELIMIEVKNISQTLDKKQILKDISLKLEDGKIYGLVGNNGCGKTMLMRCICGFVRPQKGEVEADGKVVSKDTDYLPDCGIIIETPGFIPYYNGLKNLMALAAIRGKISESEILRSMERLGLDPGWKKPVGKYSLGMRQRLGLAQAIMENPSRLILDEPMNGLDRQGVEETRNLLLELRDEGKLIIISSHNAEDIRILCDEVYEMDKGEIYAHVTA